MEERRAASYGVDGGQGQGEVEVVGVVDVSVLHEPQVLIPHHLLAAHTGQSLRFADNIATVKREINATEFSCILRLR